MQSIDRLPVSPGERAPDFRLAAIDGTQPIALSDYVGASPLFLALSIGLWCPFCRRSIAQLAAVRPKLSELGVETLCVVATDVDNAQLYFKFRPMRLRLAADPQMSTHRAYRLPKPVPTPDLLAQLETLRINPDGVFPEPRPLQEVADAFSKLDGYEPNATDAAEYERQWPQLKGQFLIDREGVVRWSNIECGREGLAGLGGFPSAEEIVVAAKEVARH